MRVAADNAIKWYRKPQNGTEYKKWVAEIEIVILTILVNLFY